MSEPHLPPATTSLDKYLKKRGFTAHQAAALVCTLAQKLESAHARGSIHGDLQPVHILLAPDGTPSIGHAPSRRTAAGGGTSTYLAPEQIDSERGPVGPATDIWGLGTILYELLVGQPPFVGDTPDQTRQQILTEEPPWPRDLRPDLPQDLNDICLMCLQKKPGQRYATMGELADDLERFLHGGHPHAPTPNAVPIAVPTVQPQAVPMVLGLLEPTAAPVAYAIEKKKPPNPMTVVVICIVIAFFMFAAFGLILFFGL